MKSIQYFVPFLLCLSLEVSFAKRASLHELLKRNKEVVSVENEYSASGFEDPPVQNENRRVLVVGEADEQPNFVYDDTPDQDSPSKPALIPDADVYESSVRNIRPSNVGDDVKDYTDPYRNIASAPSYSDPQLLAAVMNQADKANFRYPVRSPPKNKPQEASSTLGRPSYAQPERNEVKPHSLFPSDFHEFLDIPTQIQTEPEQPSPPRRPAQPSSTNPLVIGGYANTNINGKIIQTQQEKDEDENTRKNEEIDSGNHRKRVTVIRPTPFVNFNPVDATSKEELSKQADKAAPDPNKPRPTRVPLAPISNGGFPHKTRPAISSPQRYEPSDETDFNDEAPFGTKLNKPPKQKEQKVEINKSQFKPSKPDPFFPPFQPINNVYLGNQLSNAQVQKKPEPQHFPSTSFNTPFRAPNQHHSVQSLPPVQHSAPQRPASTPYQEPTVNFQGNSNIFSANSAPLPWHPPPLRTNPPAHNQFQAPPRQPVVYNPQLVSPPIGNEYTESIQPHQRPHFGMLPPQDVLRQNNLPPPTRPRNRPQRKSGGRPPFLRRRPSFLESFGFFKNPWKLNRRKGETAQNANKSPNIVTDKKGGRYILSHKPLHINAQKVVVLGPFKNPPIGAPMINPQNVVSSGKKVAVSPASSLLPPSRYQTQKKSELTTKQILPKKRGPSFKVIHLKDNKKDKLAQGSVTTPSPNLIEDDNIAASPKFKRKVDNVVYGKHVQPLNKARSTTVKEVTGTYNVAAPKQRVPLNLQEVSDYDKERIIAAKFYFPQTPSIKRVGMERHIIPIPVPIMTPKGKQILGFQDIVVPKKAANRRMDVSPRLQKQRYQSRSKKRQNPYRSRIFRQMPTSVPTNRFNPNILKRGFSGVHPQPESFVEPSISKVNYGGWRAVGDEKEAKSPKKKTPQAKSMATEEVKERNLVRYSSKLKVELDDRDDAFLVEPGSKSSVL